MRGSNAKLKRWNENTTSNLSLFSTLLKNFLSRRQSQSRQSGFARKMILRKVKIPF